MIAIFWVYIEGYQIDVRFFFTPKSLTLRFPSKVTYVIKLTFVDYKFIFLLVGASLLALAKSIYYPRNDFSPDHPKCIVILPGCI